MNVAISNAQRAAQRQIFDASITTLAERMPFADDDDRKVFLARMQERYDEQLYELAPDRPRWFDVDERATLLDRLDFFSEDEHSIDESVQRDDDLLRVVLLEAMRCDETLIGADLSEGEREEYVAMIRQPGIGEFLSSLERQGLPIRKVDRVLRGIDWRNPVVVVADTDADVTATPGM